jgi:uncharacterized protein YajQ (UPF0234 family)
MATFSFDIVSEYDKAEMNNVFAAVEKEIANRFDFRGTPAQIDWLENKSGFKIIGSNDWQIDSIIDIVRKKLASREQSIKTLDLSKEITAGNLRATKEILFVSGLNQDKAKQVTKILRDKLPKIKAQIQGESVRVSSASKDELQAAMSAVRSADLDFPINFENYR